MLLDTLRYDNLIAGDVDIVTDEIEIGASQTIKRGDLLEKTVTDSFTVADTVVTVSSTTASNYVRPSGAASRSSFYAVATEDVTTGAGETAKTIGYKAGWFNSNSMRFGGSSTPEDNKDILAEKGIFLTAEIPQ